MINKVLNFVEKKFFQKFFFRKICQIGHSHLLNYRSKYKDITNLNDLDYKIFSQNGEDGIIDYLLYTLNIDKPNFIEIGIGDYNEANTRFLFETKNSKGLIIDCIEDLEKKVKKNVLLWKGDLQILQKVINEENIIDILNKFNFNNGVDLFSLDIDGIDFWILKKLPEKFSKIAIIEYNSNFGSELEISVPNILNFNRTDYHYSNLCFGASLKAIINLMKLKGFTFIGTNKSCVNAFFILDEEVKKLGIKLPKTEDLKKYTDSNIRESRSADGRLNFLSGKNKIKSISECEVINLSSKNYDKVKIKDLIK